MNNLLRVGIKGEERFSATGLLGLFNNFPDQSLMSEVEPIKIADGHD
jgi:hypothetical protein